MKDEIERQRPKVEEGGKEAPILIPLIAIRSRVLEMAHLVLHKNHPEAVEELKWRDDLALYECTR